VQEFKNLWYYDIIYNKWDPVVANPEIFWPAFGASVVAEYGIASY
jgi:hypothetical protein